jgi:hypothetical protein
MTSAPERRPVFTVVMATYGRGRHILPSITSVLRQDLADFELLVIGDATTDETEAVVASVPDPRLRWLNLTTRFVSQSGPNNAGIEAAQGEIIAYLGHDDIWEPDHLSRLAALYRSANPPDFAVSGSILHLPNGVPGSEVLGLFGDDDDVGAYFLPPSSFSHRKSAIATTGPWRLPADCRAPVDMDLLQRALAAGLRFRSTGVVTVQKFSAAQRYLSYVRQTSDEQEAMLVDLDAPDHAGRIAALVEDARRRGTYMVKGLPDFSRFAPGELARQSTQRRGLTTVPLQALGGGVTLRHRHEQGALDWRKAPVLGLRRAKVNPRPRVLLPVTGGRARLSFLLACRKGAGLAPMVLSVNGQPQRVVPGRRWFGLVAWFARYRVEIGLSATEASILELQLPTPDIAGTGPRGYAIGPLRLSPA